MSALVIGDTTNPTMSSRDIAEITGKEHKNVVRDVRVMLIGLYGDDHIKKIVPENYRNRHSEFVRENADAILNAIVGDGSNLSHQDVRGFSWHRDSRGYVVSFDLDKTHTMTLISGYNVKLRKTIIDRWQVCALPSPAWLYYLLTFQANSPLEQTLPSGLIEPSEAGSMWLLTPRNRTATICSCIRSNPFPNSPHGSIA